MGTESRSGGGSIYRVPLSQGKSPARLLQVGPDSKQAKERGVFCYAPRPVNMLGEDTLIVNAVCNARFPERDKAGQVGNVLLLNVRDGNIRNLTKLDRKGGRYAKALAYVPEDKVILVEVSEVAGDDFPVPKKDTGRGVFLNVDGKQIPAGTARAAGQLYNKWKWARPRLTRLPGTRGHMWEMRSVIGPSTRILHDRTTETIVMRLSGDVFVVSGNRCGSYLRDAKTGLLVRISPWTGVGYIENSGKIIVRESRGKRSPKFHIVDVRRVLADVSARVADSTSDDDVKARPVSKNGDKNK